jgi:hypothetical protein
VILYHATTPAKVRRYHETGRILAPVRGWDTLAAALAWAARTGRSVVLRIDSADANAYPLPDHRSPLGRAHWIDSDVPEWECMVSPARVHAAAAMQAAIEAAPAAPEEKPK